MFWFDWLCEIDLNKVEQCELYGLYGMYKLEANNTSCRMCAGCTWYKV